MEIKNRLFSFKTGRDNKLVNKTSVIPSSPTLPDEFTTEIVNSIPFARFNNNRDLLLYLFNNVSEINALVTYVAQKAADIPVKHVKVLANGKHKNLGETDIIKLLKKPNHLNNGRAFMVNSISSFFVFGFIPLNKIVPIGWQDPSELYLFPGNQFYPIPEKSVNQYGQPAWGVDFRMNKIKQYRLFIDSRPYNFTPEEIIMINDSNLSFVNGSYLTGQSRLYSAIRSIETLSYIYDTVNTLIANKGAEGILVKRSRAGEIDTAWDPDDKKAVEDKLYSYGTIRGKRPIAVTTKDLGFVRLSVPVGDFMPVQLKEHEFRTLARAILFPSKILNDTAASTYNNVAEAMTAFYNDCLIPVVNLYYEALNNSLGLSERGEALIPVYDDIPALQDDEKTLADVNKVWNEVFEKLWNNNMVTRNQWLEYLGLPRVSDPEFDKRKNELKPENQQTIPNESTEENENNAE